MTAADPPARHADRSRLAGGVELLAGIAVTLAVTAGYWRGNAGGGAWVQAIPSLTVLLGLLLVLAAVVRFEVLVLVVLGARASLDAVKQSGLLPGDASPAELVAVGFMLASATWLLARRGQDAPRVPVSWASAGLALFLGAASLSVVGSTHPRLGLVEVTRMSAALVMLVVLERLLDDPARLKRLLVAISLSALPPLALGMHQLTTGSGTLDIAGFSRVRGTFLHSNPFGMYLTLLLVLGVAVHPQVGRAGRRWIVALGVPTVVVLVGTYMRGAWLAGAVGLLVVAALQRRRLLAAGVVTVVVGGLLLSPVQGRFADLSETRSLRGEPANSLAWRLDYWGELVELTDQAPLTGIGIGVVAQTTDTAKAPHNDLVRAFAETGAIGLVAYLLFLLGLVATCGRALRNAPSGLGRALAVAFAGALSAYLVLSVSANIMSQVVVQWYFMALVAMASVMGRRDKCHSLPPASGPTMGPVPSRAPQGWR